MVHTDESVNALKLDIKTPMKPASDFWKRQSDCPDISDPENIDPTQKGIGSYINSLNRLSLDSILRAVRVYDVAKETPLDYACCLSEDTGNKVWLKREDLQPVFSFKLRGAYNKMVAIPSDRRQLGVTTCSAGNHAQGVAYSARHLGVSAKIFMPTITPTIKVNAVRRLGAEVVLFGATFDEAQAACQECAAVEGRVLVHPFDDLEVIAGQGSIGFEILKQHHGNIDAVFISAGGGGLIAGVGSCIKAISPRIKVIGVEGVECPSLTESLKNGMITTLDSIGTFADGTAVKTIGRNTFRICHEGAVVDETVLVTTDEICAAIKDGFTDVRVVLEPSGALAIAGMKKYIKRNDCKDRSFVAILSGANTDFDRLRFISSRADTSEHLIGIVIPEKPGVFKKLYDLLHPRCITEFSYRIAGTDPTDESPLTKNSDETEVTPLAYILMSYKSLPEFGDVADFEAVKLALENAGMKVKDLQNNDLAKNHGRHLVGGRSIAAKDEILCRFEYPERPGSLKSFLHVLPDKWNVSLFHYRNHGSDVAKILAGLQVSQSSRNEFLQFLKQLKQQGYQCFVETDNAYYTMFLKHTTET